ncbi:hypothetical protein D3C72_985070 [compost metagenome]
MEGTPHDERDAMTSARHGLSKSRLAAFEQCPRRLWLSVHARDLAQADPGAGAGFAAGHEVGAVACMLLPDGVMVEAKPGLVAALSKTRALLDAGWDRPIFEATFEHDGVLVRVDVLEPDGSGGWLMAEVKGTTKPKAHHLPDLATQAWVAREAGLSITSAAIRHVDSGFVLAQEGRFDGLFADAECIELVEPIVAGRADVVADARAVLAGGEPGVKPGDHCRDPFPCEFEGYCRRGQPAGPEWPVTILPHGGGRAWLEEGVDDLLALSEDQLANPLHKRVHRATATGVPYHDVEGARSAISAWAWPRAYLDFETIGFAVPRWIGTGPYQQVPFQFSVHVEQADGQLDHGEFLDLGGGDPRRGCAEALLALVPGEGAVIGYNASFERGRILELAGAFPDLKEALEDMAARVVDLLPVTRAHWYHRDQRGSWSIKAVLPTVAPHLDYGGLEVKDGGQAQEAYMEAISGAGEARRVALDRGLRVYCGRDTEAMVVLAHRLCSEPAT